MSSFCHTNSCLLFQFILFQTSSSGQRLEWHLGLILDSPATLDTCWLFNTQFKKILSSFYSLATYDSVSCSGRCQALLFFLRTKFSSKHSLDRVTWRMLRRVEDRAALEEIVGFNHSTLSVINETVEWCYPEGDQIHVLVELDRRTHQENSFRRRRSDYHGGWFLHNYCCQDRGLRAPWANASARTDAPLPGFRWQRLERYYIGTSIHCHFDTTKAHAFQSELVARW